MQRFDEGAAGVVIRPVAVVDQITGMHVLVAEVDGRIVGRALVRLTRRRHRLVGRVALGIDAGAEHPGLDRRLLRALLQLTDAELGLERLEVEVLADNAPTLQLYESLGFARETAQSKRIFNPRRLSGLDYRPVVLLARTRPPEPAASSESTR